VKTAIGKAVSVPLRVITSTAIVLDASVAVKVIAREDDSSTADEVLLANRLLVAPDFMLLEAANAFWKKLRRHDWTTEMHGDALLKLDRLNIELVPTGSIAMSAAELSASLDHPVHDCAYIALAMARGAMIATFDERLARAAARAEVRLWQAS
jgi:predicted nucleic acid-binding protein